MVDPRVRIAKIRDQSCRAPKTAPTFPSANVWRLRIG